MCQRLSLPMLDTPATSYIGALEARREIEMRFEATLAEFGANAFYATPTILRTAPRVPTDLDDQDALLNGFGPDPEHGNPQRGVNHVSPRYWASPGAWAPVSCDIRACHLCVRCVRE